MKIFDVHVHVQPWEMMKAGPLALMDRAPAEVRNTLSSARNVLEYLDQSGVERICCINYVSPDVMGFTREVNEWIAAFTRADRDRLFPVGSVHPLYEKKSADEIRRVLDLGIRMIKIHPPHQRFSANAYKHDLPGLADVYRECEQRRVPVMFHTGTSIFPGARNIFADPMPIDDVAIDFPELRIILAHAGRPMYGETAFFLARRHPNVFVDLSGFPPRALETYFPRAASLPDKLLWGTDWPSPGIVSMSKNIEDFQSLGFDPAFQEKVFWSNANRLFSGE
ncbi:MAG TPA: amidohydrolase family protein [Thermoanaerobaculia bacterium]|nr:amidohydrolase family protein [Thermoanaerobaculia bacterium]